MQAKLTTSNRYGNLWVCNLSSRTPFSHHWQVSMSEEQRPGFQSTEEKVGMQDNKLHEGPQQGLVLTHAPITVSTACILFQTLLNAPHTPWENICFCTQIAILLLYSHIYMNIILVHMREREKGCAHTYFCTETELKAPLNNKIITKIISLSHQNRIGMTRESYKNIAYNILFHTSNSGYPMHIPRWYTDILLTQIMQGSLHTEPPERSHTTSFFSSHQTSLFVFCILRRRNNFLQEDQVTGHYSVEADCKLFTRSFLLWN